MRRGKWNFTHFMWIIHPSVHHQYTRMGYTNCPSAENTMYTIWADNQYSIMNTSRFLINPNSNTLLVVDIYGSVIQLYTPFSVVCIYQLQHIPYKGTVVVESIISHPTYVLCYYIQQRWYPYYYFIVWVVVDTERVMLYFLFRQFTTIYPRAVLSFFFWDGLALCNHKVPWKVKI